MNKSNEKTILETNLLEQKEKLIKNIKKYYGNNPKKYKFDVTMTNELYNKIKDGDINEVEEMLNALEYKYKKKREFRNLGI